MTQLELPPISIGRYFELLKRRRWQVIPTSVAGLLIGGIVAFFIPRYYVAETTLVYQGQVLDEQKMSQSDPILGLVANAALSIPETTPKVLEEFGIVGARENDVVRQAIIDEYKDRITVKQVEFDEKGRVVNIVIEYRDTNGEFAARFANRLRDLWVDSVRTTFEEQARAELQRASEEVAAAQGARNRALQDLKNHQTEFTLDFRDIPGGQAGQQRQYENVLREQRRLLVDVDSRIEGITEAISGIEAALRDIDRELFEEVPLAEDQANNPLIRQAAEDFAYYTRALLGVHPGHSQHAAYQKALDDAKARLAELAPNAIDKIPRRRSKPNPRWDELQGDLRMRRIELRAAEAEREPLRREIARLEKELLELPTIWQVYETYLGRYDSAKTELEDAEAVERDYRRRFEKARTGQPFRIAASAIEPVAPTDPNITLVALAGCVVGLGAAIALVLILDVVRTTFKTVDDVQYVLKLPVLGSMAHLETTEERARAVGHRRRVSLVAASFLFLSLSVVTIYYVAPTRLPVAVFQALRLLLGHEQ